MIIGLIGFKQVGKSTAAKYLAEEHGFIRHNFKDALVAELKANFPDLLHAIVKTMDQTEYNGMNPWTVERLFEEKPPLMRALMQNYGTDVRRTDDKNYWVKQYAKTITQLKNIVTDDVRFHNEAACIKSRGGILVRLTRPDIESGGTHTSETEQLDIVADYTVEVGQGEHEKLYIELDKIVTGL